MLLCTSPEVLSACVKLVSRRHDLVLLQDASKVRQSAVFSDIAGVLGAQTVEDVPALDDVHGYMRGSARHLAEEGGRSR